jgi:hypothetical protein
MISGISPGVEILVDVAGWRRVIRIERAIRSLYGWRIPPEHPTLAFWSRLNWYTKCRRSLRREVVREFLASDGLISSVSMEGRRYIPHPAGKSHRLGPIALPPPRRRPTD